MLKFCKVVWQQIWVEVVDLTQSFSGVHPRIRQWKNIIKIGPHLRELWGTILRAWFFETRCKYVVAEAGIQVFFAEQFSEDIVVVYFFAWWRWADIATILCCIWS